MRKKIMVAEKSDAIRSIAETILHQNGYDVLTASTIEKAKELIIAGLPNMVIIGADLKDSEGIYLYDSLDENEVTSSIPLLIIADPDGRELPYPEEVILPRPFNPSEFLERVKLFVGGGLSDDAPGGKTSAESFSVDSVDDEFLDSALGVDNIEVEESEVLNQTTGITHIKKKADASKKKDVFETHRPDDEEAESKKSETVESLLIRDEDSGKVISDQNKNGKMAASSKIELSSDQYGLTDEEDSEPKQKSPEPESDKPKSEGDKNHDYDWFIDEMKKETNTPADTPPKNKMGDSGLVKTPTSEAIEPIAFPKEEEKPDSSKKEQSGAEITPGGVDKFISDFKQEAERINAETDDTDSGTSADSPGKKATETVSTQVVEKKAEAPPQVPTERLIDEEIRHFCTNLVEILSEKLAKKIVDKIDKDELYKTIRQDLQDLISNSK